MKIVFVIPTKNEESTIQKIMLELKKIAQNHNYEIVKIILTDDSRDKTREIATSLGAQIVIGGGAGLGTAMYKGLKAAVEHQCDVVFSIDGDGQVDLSEIPFFLSEMNKANADLVLGSRFLRNKDIDYNYKFINRFGVRILTWILRKNTKLPITDSHGGIRAMKPEVIQNLKMLGSHTYVQETILDAFENGFKIIEIPSRWLKREHGKSRVVLSIPTYICYTLPILIMRSKQHIKLFFGSGLFLIFLSFLQIAIVFYLTQGSFQAMFDRQSFHLFFLLFLSGLNLFFFGVMLEFLGQIRQARS